MRDAAVRGALGGLMFIALFIVLGLTARMAWALFSLGWNGP